MLPRELVDILSAHLSIDSLLALSQTSSSWRQAINDTIFEDRLKRTCPWFEPHLSNRSSWKECAVIYSRRFSQRLAPDFKLVDFVDPPVKLETGAPRLDNKKLFENPVYTSDHGIAVDLSDYVKHLRKRPDYERDDNFTRVISLPHMLIVIWLSSTMCSWVNMCDIRVKFGDSKRQEADIYRQLEVHDMPWFQVLGSHVFLVTIEYWNSDRDPRWTLWYVDRQIRFLHRVDGERPQSVICYDGLFHYFEDDEVHAFQVGLDGLVFADTTGTSFAVTASGMWMEKDEVYPWSVHSVLLDEDNRPYIVDIEKRVVVAAKKDGTVVSSA